MLRNKEKVKHKEERKSVREIVGQRELGKRGKKSCDDKERKQTFNRQATKIDQ